MSTVKTLVRRIVTLFFRDKGTVFYSILASLIMFAVYYLFLGQAYVSDDVLEVMPKYLSMQSIWLMAGIIFITSFSSSFNGMGQLPYDRRTHIVDDIYVSPVDRGSIVGGYVLGAAVCSLIMSILTILLAYIYLWIKIGFVPGVLATVQALGVVIMAIVMNSALAFFTATFINSPQSYGSITSVLLTMIGFLAGVYIPIGSLGKTVKIVLSVLPTTHVIALLRQVMLADIFAQSTTSANAAFLGGLREYMGIDIVIGDLQVQPWLSLVYVLGVTVLLFFVSARKISKAAVK